MSAKKKRLIILAGPLDSQSAGIYRVTFEMVNALHNTAELPFDIVLIREKKSDAFPRFKTIAAPTYRFIPGYSIFRLFVWLPLLCLFNKADYVFEPAHMGPFNLPGDIKRITLIHDLTPILYPHYHRFLSATLQRLLMPLVLKHADAVIALSDNTVKDLHTHYPETLQKTYKLPIGPSSYIAIPPHESVLCKYNIERPYLLSFGTIEPRKNLVLLLEAFATLKKDSAFNHKLVIAGAMGWKTSEFDLALAQHPNRDDIILTGYIQNDEISSLYYYTDINICCSHYEGFGISAFDSMYLNKTTVLPYNSSFMETGEDYAVFYEDNMLEDLVFALRKCLRSSNTDSKAYPHSQYYTWNNFVDKFCTFITST
jgi:glycosyltransferase involved in cell wall biosynthesis